MCSGALTGAVGEVLKYDVRRIDYVDINPTLIALANGHAAALNDRKVRVINEDPRVFVREAEPEYDVVMLNAPEPATLQANRLYTLEFFGDVKRILHPGGVMSFGLLPGTDYQSDEARLINSTMMNTLKSTFREVLIVPGNRMYFLASDSALSLSIGKLIEQRGINTAYVNKFYLDEEDMARRSKLILNSLSAEAPVNGDLEPVSYYHQIAYWLTYFRLNLWPLVIVGAVFLYVVISRLNPVSAGMFTGGFAASSLEIVLLFAFQILYGYVYQMLGVILALFMIGLAAGSHLAPRLFPSPGSRDYIRIQIGIGVYCFLLPVVLVLTRNVLAFRILVIGIFCLLAFVIAVLIGLEFSLAATLRRGGTQHVASELYTADLIGSSLGALLAGTILIPVCGLVGVGVMAGLMSLGSSLAAFAGRRSIDNLNI